jgi:FkbM family methyltransferase
MHEVLKEGVVYRFEKTTDDKETHEWLLKDFPIWEPNTFRCFRKVANSSKLAIDIGAWIGLTGIWLAKNFKHVVCVEADKMSIDPLRSNLESSGCQNYTIIPSAVFNINTTIYFGTNSFRECALNCSMSQLKTLSDKKDDYPVNTVTLADITKDIPTSDIGFIKVDIEGGEESIMDDLVSFSTTHRVPLLISFHVAWWKNKDVSRFAYLFKNVCIESETGQSITDVVDYLLKNPWGSILCTYPVDIEQV